MTQAPPSSQGRCPDEEAICRFLSPSLLPSWLLQSPRIVFVLQQQRKLQSEPRPEELLLEVVAFAVYLSLEPVKKLWNCGFRILRSSRQRLQVFVLFLFG